MRAHIPNLLTSARLAATPLLALLILLPGRWPTVWAAALLVAMALSDGLDGWLARRWQVRSDLGALLDPLADKVVVVALMLPMAWRSQSLGLLTPLRSSGALPNDAEGVPLWTYLLGLPWWIVALVLGREVLITAWRHLQRHRTGTVHEAAWWGKVKALVPVSVGKCPEPGNFPAA